MTRTVLVTGGAGFIGSHLCESLLNDGYRVVCVDNLSSGRMTNIESHVAHDRFVFIEADVRLSVKQQLEEHLDIGDLDGIYHLASRASPTDFETHPVEIATTNAIGTQNVLTIAEEEDLPVVFASTSEVYGDPDIHPQPEEYNGNVNIQGPRACYDEGKRYGEALIHAFRTRYDLDARTARIFNTYGPRMRRDDGRVIPTFVTRALDGENLPVHGTGMQTRTFLYVDDQVRGLRKLMAAEDPPVRVFNIGGTQEISIKRLAAEILERVETDACIEYTARPPGDPERRKPDISRAKRVLDWSQKTSLDRGLSSTIAYFKQL